MQSFRNINEYISAQPKDVRILLKQIRATIRKAAPAAEETIKYGMPCYMLEGNLVYFAGYRNHVSIYPAPRQADAFKEILSRYKGGKGTVQFPIGEPLPLTLITRMVKYLVQQRRHRNALKKSGKKV